MSITKMVEPVSEVEMLRRRVAQLERIVEELRNPPVYGGVPKWCPPATMGEQYWLGAPQANVAH